MKTKMDPSLSIVIEEVATVEGDSSHEVRAAANNVEVKTLESSMWKTLTALTRPDKSGPTIFRVPDKYRQKKEKVIQPSVVSIGPYHRDYKPLLPMQDKKWWLLKDILSQCDNELTLKEGVEKIRDKQMQARSCYSESTVDMNDDKFVEMLILDGTFIIQFIQSPDWFIRETGWASHCIATDLIMMENQMPFFAVEILWDLYFPGSPIDPQRFTSRLCANFQPGFIKTPPNKVQLPNKSLRGNIATPEKLESGKFHHLLHLCHNYLVPDMSTYDLVLPACCCFELCSKLNCHSLLPCVSGKEERRQQQYVIPSATELKAAGIKIRKKKKNPCDDMMKVTFKGGKLEIPSIEMHDLIEPLFTNLIAFEQSHSLSAPAGHLISYAAFMDSLINSQQDVAILAKHGIIENMLSGEEEVARVFNQLCDGTIVSDKHYLLKLFEEVNLYYDSCFHRSRAKLIREYFNSPWSTIASVAACILLGLTVAQTYYAGYDHYHPAP